MKNVLRRLISLCLALTLAIGTGVIANSDVTAQALTKEELVDGETVEFGLYPQSKVKDEDILAQLNSLRLTWTYYEYYEGTSNSDVTGTMKRQNMVRYSDVELNGEKYRAVYMEKYRPNSTIIISSPDNTLIDIYGYELNTVYWFKYEPIQWTVLDAENGIMITKKSIDAQPFNNNAYSYGDGIYSDMNYNYADDYSTSSLRDWLNGTFLSTAFSDDDVKSMAKTDVVTGTKTTNDYVYILSLEEAANPEYGFNEDHTAKDTARRAGSTSYAISQGLINQVNGTNWYTRSPGNAAYEHIAVTAISHSGNSDANFMTCATTLGIRPVIKIKSFEKSYNLTLNANGGAFADGTEETVVELKAGEDISKVGIPARTGYSFVSWNEQLPDVMPENDVSVTAIWKANSYDAIFDANGGTWADGESEKRVSTEYETEIIAPEAPEKQGYLFSKWSPEIGIMDDVNGKKFTAEWIPATDTVYTVETYTMNTSGEYEKETQTFRGTTEEKVTAEYSVETGFALNTEKSVLEGTVAADNSLVLKVYCDRNKYTFTTVVDGVSKTESYYYGEAITKPDTPVKNGYEFTGWGGEIPEYMPAEDMAFTAAWKANSYDAIFDANGGTWADGESEKRVSTEYETEIIAPESPEKQGYVFSKWSPEIGIMDDVNGKKFTAEWIPATNTVYTVETYTMNTSGEYEKETQTFRGTTEEKVTAEYSVETGFVLNTEKSILEGTVAADNSLVLKVYCDRNKYTFTTVVDGVSKTESYYYGEAITKPDTPVKNGCKFMKWEGEIPGTMPSENVTITAVFEKSYVCPDCGKEILGEEVINAHIAEEARMKADVVIRNNNGSKTIRYGETLRLTAVTSNMPADAKVCWYVDGEKQSEGNTFDVDFESGTKTVEVKLVDANGEILKNANGEEISDSEKVTVNSGLWQKIVSFFKNLFRMNRTVIQSIFA